jgi:hypothetical protein
VCLVASKVFIECFEYTVGVFILLVNVVVYDVKASVALRKSLP